MFLYEELEKSENKKSFRELVMKYHPDRKGGSEEMMKKLNDAADKGDAAFERFREEITGKKSSRQERDKETESFFDDLEKELIGHPKVISIKKFGKTVIGENFRVILKGDINISIVHIKHTTPMFEIAVFKNDEFMQWNVGDGYRDQLRIRSGKGAITAVKNIIKNIDTLKPSEEDPYEDMERETYRDSKR